RLCRFSARDHPLSLQGCSLVAAERAAHEHIDLRHGVRREPGDTRDEPWIVPTEWIDRGGFGEIGADVAAVENSRTGVETALDRESVTRPRGDVQEHAVV